MASHSRCIEITIIILFINLSLLFSSFLIPFYKLYRTALLMSVKETIQIIQIK